MLTQIRKKWTDIKSISKQAVAKYKNDISRTGGGTSGNTPTELQFRIAGFIGTVNTQGIAGTKMCDTSASTSTFVQQMQIVNNEILPSLDLTTSSSAVSQRSKTKWEIQHEEIISVEKKLLLGVNAIKTELERTNNTMELMLAEMKRTNSVEEQLVGMLACTMNRHDDSTY